MSFKQELTSWLSPSTPNTPLSSPPSIGSKAPSDNKLPFPTKDGKPVIVTFLRHCGCPFAEKTFLNLRETATRYKDTITFVAVSHSDEASTQNWLQAVTNGTPLPENMRVIVDAERETYAKWGLGTSSTWHVLNPWSLWNVVTLGREEKIWNRPTESGSRWQMAGSWAVDGEGVVRWGGVARAADEVRDFGEAVEGLGVKG